MPIVKSNPTEEMIKDLNAAEEVLAELDQYAANGTTLLRS